MVQDVNNDCIRFLPVGAALTERKIRCERKTEVENLDNGLLLPELLSGFVFDR